MFPLKLGTWPINWLFSTLQDLKLLDNITNNKDKNR